MRGAAKAASLFYLGRRGWKLREDVDHVVVGVDDLGVALTPERVPGILLRPEAGLHDTRVCRVDLAGRRAFERETHAMAFRLGPVRVELLNQLEGVPHQADAARECRVQVIVDRV